MVVVRIHFTWLHLGARFAFDIYDFEGKARMDLFYLGDVMRGLNLSPTLQVLTDLGMTKKKGEKYITLNEFYPMYSEVKKGKDQVRRSTLSEKKLLVTNCSENISRTIG